MTRTIRAEMGLRKAARVLAEVCEDYGLDYASVAVISGDDGIWMSGTCTRGDEPFVGFAEMGGDDD